MNILAVFLWLVKQDWCEAILEQMWGSTSLGRGGVFSEVKEQFHSGRSPGYQWSGFTDGMLYSKSRFFICSYRRWSDLLCSRRCLHDHSHQTLEKETLRYSPQLVKTVAKEIMRVESSKQIRSQICCSVTIIRSFKKMLIVDSVKKNTKLWTWPLRKNEKQPEP